jgi:excisionase family DNA binding protein
MRESLIPYTPPVNPLANRPQAEYKPDEDRALMTVQQAADFVGVSRVRIDAAIATRELAVVLLGPATCRIWFPDLKKWLASKTVKPLPASRWIG